MCPIYAARLVCYMICSSRHRNINIYTCSSLYLYIVHTFVMDLHNYMHMCILDSSCDYMHMTPLCVFATLFQNV